MQEILYFAFITCLTVGGIHIFYNAFKTRWPELYFSTSDQVDYFISVTATRYIAFRLLPVFMIIVIIFGSFGNLSKIESSILGMTIGIIHSSLTNFVALVKILIGSKSVAKFHNKTSQIIIHIVSIILVTLTGFVAGLSSTTKVVSYIIPSREGLIDNIWSSLFTAIFAIYLYRIYEKNQVVEEILFQKSIDSISPDLIKYIDEYSLEHDVDNNLIKAIAIVENLQRPNWLRKLERIKSIFVKSGSYGIMQVKSDKYISDKESIRIAINKYFNKISNIRSENDLSEIVFTYNKNKDYNELVIKAYNHLKPLEL